MTCITQKYEYKNTSGVAENWMDFRPAGEATPPVGLQHAVRNLHELSFVGYVHRRITDMNLEDWLAVYSEAVEVLMLCSPKC